MVLARSSRVNRIVALKSGCRLPCFASSWSLVPSHVFLGKTLLDGLRFPIIVSNPPSVLNHSGTKLAEHGLCSDDGNLPRSVRIRKDLLVYQFVLLLLGSNDLEQRSILVEKQIRVPVAQNASTLRCQHESFFTSVGYVECPNFELTAALRKTLRVDLCLSRTIVFPRYVFIPFRVQLIRGMISDRR